MRVRTFIFCCITCLLKVLDTVFTNLSKCSSKIFFFFFCFTEFDIDFNLFSPWAYTVFAESLNERKKHYAFPAILFSFRLNFFA